MTLEESAFRQKYIEDYLLSTLQMEIQCAECNTANVFEMVSIFFPKLTEQLLEEFSNTAKEEKTVFYREHRVVFSSCLYYLSACDLADEAMGISTDRASGHSGKVSIWGTLYHHWKARLLKYRYRDILRGDWEDDE